MAIIIAALIVLGTLYLFWRLMISNKEELNEENLPLITAESTPLTLPPSDDERTQNPHTDKAVYGLISDAKTVEPQMIPHTEEPIMITAPAPTPTPLETSMAPSMASRPPSPEDSSSTVQATSIPSVGGLYTVQMASLPSHLLVETEQKTIRKKYASILSALPSTIVEKTIPDKGTFFRLCYGSFPSKAEANALCQKLKAEGASCLVTERSNGS